MHIAHSINKTRKPTSGISGHKGSHGPGAVNQSRSSCPKPKIRITTFQGSFAVIIIILAIWLVLYFTTGWKAFSMPAFMGICVGFAWGKKSRTRTNGIIPALMVFVFSVVCTSLITLHLLSLKLEMNFLELEDHFGLPALMEAVAEQFGFPDVAFLIVAAIVAAFIAIRLNRKRIYIFNQPPKNKYHDTRRTGTNLQKMHKP